MCTLALLTYFMKNYNFLILALVCSCCTNSNKTIPCIVDNTTIDVVLDSLSKQQYLNELLILENLDQKYRIGNVEDENFLNLQPNLDSKNREKLDSLYCIYGFPNKSNVGYKGFSAAWLLMHHSSDCRWNTKWLKRFLSNHIVDDGKDLRSLLITINRHYSYENGRCSFHDIESLLDSFPSLEAQICNSISISSYF